MIFNDFIMQFIKEVGELKNKAVKGNETLSVNPQF